jgi:anthranilate synthase component II
MRIVIVDNYDSFTFNLYQMLQVMVSDRIQVLRNDALDFTALRALRPDKIVLSPGPGHPKNADDFGICKDIIVRSRELGCPVLGVCLGLQGVVHHLGGQVVQAPYIVHGKSSKIKVTKSVLFDGLPETFEAMRYHSLVASDESFPAELTVTGREVEHDLIMALEHRSLPIFGVQFHPESIGTPEGQKILKNFVERC